MKKILNFLIMICLFLFVCDSVIAENARSLNTRGFRLYKQKKYVEALELFKQATVADPNYAMAHYNAACTLGVLHKLGGVCEYDAYRGTIINYLRRAVELDPRRGERMKTDSDLDPVRDTFAYQILAGLSLEKEKDLRLILQRVTWYSIHSGTIGPLARIVFKRDGRAILLSFSLGNEGLITKKEVAVYRLDGTQIIIIRKNRNGESISATGQLTKAGELRFSKEMPKDMQRLMDDPANCSA